MSDLQSTSSKTICPFCSCRCDDLVLRVEGGCIKEVSPDCERAREGYSAFSNIDQSPEVNGRSVGWMEAFSIAGDLLNKALFPVVLLGSGVPQESALHAIEFAGSISACVDVAGAGFQSKGRWMVETGTHSCSVVDLREHSDLIVAWGISPFQSHPRFWDRYILSGIKKTIIAIDCSFPKEMEMTSMRSDSQQVVEKIAYLRLALKGEKVNLPWIPLLLEHFKKSRSGVFLLGEGFFKQDDVALAEILQFIKILEKVNNSHWFSMILRDDEGLQCGQSALLESTGFPSGVKFSGGLSEFSPIEFSIDHLLRQGATDLVICIGQPLGIPDDCIEKLRTMDTLVISPDKPTGNKYVWLPTDRLGWGAEGTQIDLCGLPVWIPAVESPRQPSTVQILGKLKEYAS